MKFFQKRQFFFQENNHIIGSIFVTQKSKTNGSFVMTLLFVLHETKNDISDRFENDVQVFLRPPKPISARMLKNQICSFLKYFWIKLGSVEIKLKRTWVFATNSHFLIPISLEPNVVNLWYFKLILFDLAKVIAWKMSKVYDIGIQRYRD